MLPRVSTREERLHGTRPFPRGRPARLRKGRVAHHRRSIYCQVDRTAVEIDLAAEQLLAAERTGQKIAVEVKSFLGPSRMYDFHWALGQFLTYRLAIAQHEPERFL